MDLVDQAAPAAGEEEAWFLARLDEQPLPVEHLTAFLDVQAERAGGERADALAALLQDTLVEQGLHREGLDLLARRVRWVKGARASSAAWRSIADQAAGNDPALRAMVEACFADGLPAKESVRRLSLLMTLEQGHYCYDKTWGFGVVRRLDPFYKRVEIDFTRKPGHFMSYAYAAETLKHVGADHLLAMKHAQPDELERLAREDPAEVVRIALRSFGPMPVAILQERLSPEVVDAGDWKRFWDAARKVLKKDNLIDIPAKRSEPMVLLNKEKAFDEEWLEALRAERDMATLLDRMEAWLAERGPGAELGDREREVFVDRLGFVIQGAERKHHALWARAVMAGDAMGLAEALRLDRIAAELAGKATLLDTLRALPARLARPFLDFLCARDPDNLPSRLLEWLPAFEIGGLSEVIQLLTDRGMETGVAAAFKAAVAAQDANVEFCCWLGRNPDRIEQWSLGARPLIAQIMIQQMEEHYMGERLKAQNRLRERFAQNAWLKSVFEPLSDRQRREFLVRLRESTAWPSMDRMSVIARVIKLFPELESTMSDRAQEEDASAAPKGPVTSERSYRERQLQLEKVVNKDIPANSKEIAVARSYGDLRENFEFKAAKDMQGLLMRRKAELEQMLHDVRPSDFKDFPTDVAGVATTVTVRYDDGATDRYVLLGEWDSDPARHIISSTSKMAQALAGHVAGERVDVPSEHGARSCVIETIEGLSPEVRAWLDEKPWEQHENPA